MGRVYFDIRSVLDHFYTSQTRSNEILPNLSRTLSFQNSIVDQEKLKEEDEGFNVSNHIFVDSSSIRYGFSLLGFLSPRGPFKISFQELRILGFLLYKMDFLLTLDLWFSMKSKRFLYLISHELLIILLIMFECHVLHDFSLNNGLEWVVSTVW